MITQILLNTPLWVWGLLAALVWLGANQLMSRVTGFGRVVRIALAMTAFSLYGTISAFGASATALAAWLGAAVAVGWTVLQFPLAQGTRYLQAKRAFELPGSWVPLALMLSVFGVKYVAGVMLGMHLPVTQANWFNPLLGVVYGAMSGAFIGRAARLVRLAWQTDRSPAAVVAS